MAPSGDSSLGRFGYAKKETGGLVPMKTSCSMPFMKSTADSAKYGMRCTATRPRPRCRRAGEVSEISRALVAAATRPA